MHEGLKRAFKMFQEWFEIQMSSVVEDLYLDEEVQAWIDEG